MGKYPFKKKGNGGGNKGKQNNQKKKDSSTYTSKRNTLADHIFNVGTAKQASEFVTAKLFLINYIRRTFDMGEDIALALENYKELDLDAIAPKINVSRSKDDEVKAAESAQYAEQCKVDYDYHKARVVRHKANTSKANALIVSQMTSGLKAKVNARPNYSSEIEGNPIKLMQAIEQHAMNFESTQCQPKTILDALRGFLYAKQKEDESAIDHLKRFKATRDVFLSHVGKDFAFPKLLEDNIEYSSKKAEIDKAVEDGASKDVKDALDGQLFKIKKKAMAPFMSYVYLDNVDKSKYGTVLAGLQAQFSLNNDQYPKNILDAVQVIESHPFDEGYKNKKKQQRENHKDDRKKGKEEHSDTPSLSFAQIKNTCYCCGSTAHKLPDCPKRASTPKDQWYINRTKEMKSYNSMVTKINKSMSHMQATPSVASPSDTNSSVTTTPSIAATSATSTSTWQFGNFFNFHSKDDGKPQEDLSEYMILDSGSSTDLFCNKGLLKQVKPGNKSVSLTTNAGDITVDKVGTLPAYGEVPFHEDAVTNIFSLAKLVEKYRVTFDSDVDNAFYVHTPSKVVRFPKTESNLYAHKPSNAVSQSPSQAVHVQTVEENMNLHTPREVKRAKAARDALVALGSPSVQDLKSALAMNAIANLPVTTADVDLAERIFGKDLGTIKGKTVRKRPLPMVPNHIEVPKELYEQRSDLALCMDIMFVNELPYMTTITRSLYYRTALHLPTRQLKDLHESLDAALRLYNAAGFSITKVYCDGEFRPMMDPVADDMDITMEYSAPQAHVPESERNNRTIKERVRSTFHRLPYKALPIAMMRVLVVESARKLNFFPNKNGISKYFSPRQIVHRVVLDYDTNCKYAFGSYVQAHNEPDPTNTQAPRSIDAIYMRPIPNGHEVYDLSTQRIIIRRSLTLLPITPAIIRAVEAIADKQHQKGLRVKTKQGVTIYDSTWTAGVDYDSDDEDDDYENESESEDDEHEYDTEEDDESQSDQAQEILYEEQPSAGVREQGSVQEDESQEDEATQASEADKANTGEPTRKSSRTRVPTTLMSPKMHGKSHEERPMHNHLVCEQGDETLYDDDMAKIAVNLLTTVKYMGVKKTKTKGHSHLVTYSLQRGLKKFGRPGFDSAKSEMQQLHDRDCWKPISVSTLSVSERAKALESLMFLVEKKSGKIKSRHCANGSKQREWINSDEAASPTVMTESVMLTATIEAEEKRDVATFDIPNAFIQTHVDERDSQGDRIIMKIKGAMIDMLVEIDPSYEDYVAMERGQKILYVHILRAIYGMLMSGLLFYKKFRTSIEKIGYEVNPYDPCVANKIIRGKQHTISWHVDDLKSSHVDSKVNDNFHKWLQQEYGQVREVTSTRGTKHDYLGMTLDYGIPGKVKIDMKEYVVSMVEEFPCKLAGQASTPANDNLFKVDRGSKLDSLKSEAFHTFVAKALFLTKRSRIDIQPTVAFLCTRVREPTSYDWFKLKRMMDFLEKTKEDCLTLESDGSREIIWSIDAAFAVHPDMKSHTGITMKMGKGAIYSASKKQKLNTRSSTEAELVAVDDAMAPVIWTTNFLEAQGYKTKAVIVLQDNESAIRLEKNGLKSVGPRSRHINIRYFFITDQVQKGNVIIKYCPTDDMESDYMTKSLTGTKFTKHRGTIMNLPVAISRTE